jgi:hypothetical protein
MVRKLLALVQKGFTDYTIHKDDDRKDRYINRHKDKETWSLSGIKTAGFYAKNILWNKRQFKNQ